jgi:glycosyltransferase involved in cell wall biosynthesis
MKILQLIETLDTGGAERMVSWLALHLRALGHEVTIACLRDKGVMPVSDATFAGAGVPIVELRKPDGFSVDAVRRLARSVRDGGFEVVHSHNPQVHHYAVAAAGTAATTIVSTIHGTATLEMPLPARLLYRLACSRTSHVVAVSAAAAAALRERMFLGAMPVTVIANGIDLEALVGIPSRPRDRPLVFGTVGRLEPVKDQASLIRAFAAIRREADCELRILGVGTLEADLKRLALDLDVDRSVRFCGWSGDVPSFLASIDVFVLPSLSEGLPMTLLEAMAAGRPVIASRVGGIPEVLDGRETGWLVPPGQPPALAEAMRAAIATRPQLAAMGQAGRARIARDYSAREMAARYADLYRRRRGEV